MSESGKILRTYAILGTIHREMFEEGQKKMADIDLKVGQVVKTIGCQIAVPNWYERWGNRKQGFVRMGNMPIIRLSLSINPLHDADLSLPESECWRINTNRYRQSGLVCFVPEKYFGMAILSVRITKVMDKSVLAEPIEWIEVSPQLPVSWIGKDAQGVFDAYMTDSEDHPEIRAVWHNKGLAVLTCQWCNRTFTNGEVFEDNIEKFGEGGGVVCPHCWRFTNPNPEYWRIKREGVKENGNV